MAIHDIVSFQLDLKFWNLIRSMLTNLTFLCVGMALVLSLLAVRRKLFSLAGVWVLIMLMLISSPFNIPGVLLCLFLPRVLLIHTKRFFRLAIQVPRELVNALPVFVMTALYWSLDWKSHTFLILLFSFEYLQLLFFIVREYRKRGITLSSNAGLRIWMMNAWTVLPPVLFAITLLVGPNPLLGLVFLVPATWYYTRDDAYEPYTQIKYASSDLQAVEKAELTRKLQEIILRSDYLLQGNASLSGLADRLKTSTHHLSQLLNETRQQTFFGLLASVRIQKAKQLLTDPKHTHEKIEEIAALVGYASKSSFNTSFKKITGKTPSEYRDADVRPDKVERLDQQEERRTLDTNDTFGLAIITSDMLSSFFKIYFRNLSRNRVFSFINLFGLTIGISSALLIFVFLQHELSYDRFHRNAEDIYRVAWMTSNPQTRTPHPMAQAMVADFAEVEAAVSLTPVYGPGLTLQSVYIRNKENNRMFQEPDMFLADSTFFDVFDFELMVGNRSEVLRNVGDIVISESIARKYFDDVNPLGKSLEAVEYGFSGVIVGVMKDAPVASHFHPKILISYVTRKSVEPESFWWTWGDFGHFNYVRLQPGTDANKLEAAIPEWLAKYIELTPEQIADMKARRNYAALQPIVDIHLHSKIRWELESNGDITFIRILWAAIAFLILIACVNFINLTSARAFERAKEVGVRRTLGGEKNGVLVQFVAESVTTSLMALVLGYLLAAAAFSQFQSITGKPIEMIELLSLDVLIYSMTMSLLIGIISGIYPALSVLQFHPLETLKGKLVNQHKGSLLRKGLMSVQFLVSAIMIFGSLIVLDQIRFMEDKALGFDEDQVIVFDLHSDQQVRRIEAIKNEINLIPGVLATGGISNLPSGQFNQNVIYPESSQEDVVDCSELRVDFDALHVLGITLSEGRFFDPSMSQDSAGASFIVNRAAANQLNVENLYEASIIWNEEDAPRKGKVVGVLEDFHYKSLHSSVQPLAINVVPGALNYVLVKVEAGTNMSTILSELEEVHRQFDQELDFDYSFLDQLIGNQYESERRALEVFNLFTVLALLLAGLGLLALSYLIITQRTREIGIRKVVGARVLDILIMENGSFLKIVAVSLVIGLPVGYALMQFWLQSFAYQVPFHLSPFLITVGLLCGIAVATVTLAVLRTVLINPGQALRYE